MKKIFLALLPFVSLADTCHLEQVGGGDWRIVCEGSGLEYHYIDVTNEVYAIANCDELKSSLLSISENIMQSGDVLERTISYSYNDIEDVIQTVNQTISDPIQSGPILGGLNHIKTELDYGYDYAENLVNQSSTLYDEISGISCGSCPTNGASGGGSGGSCCDVDFTQIIDRMIIAELQRADISNQIARISNYLGSITNELNYLNFLVEHGFGEITNSLSYLKLDNLQFSTLNPATGLNALYGLRTLSSGTRFSVGALSMNTISANPRDNGWLPSLWWQNFDHLKILGSLNSFELNKYLNVYGPLTNNLLTIVDNIVPLTDSTTNFFSFFRGEIGVSGVLEDWTNEESDGTYHDFLTNHYINVVRGGSLSGNTSSKTNWFSRIETLLAALVFTDSAETNTVDASAGNVERQQLATSYGTANQAAATFSEDFKTTSQSIVTLYQNYFTTFETAAMPSHVVLMTLSNSDPSEQVEIAFQSDSLGILVESCRVVTTLCWSSVGIFLLYKFLVWSARCVIVACQFIYRAISSVFKS